MLTIFGKASRYHVFKYKTITSHSLSLLECQTRLIKKTKYHNAPQTTYFLMHKNANIYVCLFSADLTNPTSCPTGARDPKNISELNFTATNEL